jgi:hypothetical protein
MVTSSTVEYCRGIYGHKTMPSNSVIIKMSLRKQVIYSLLSVKVFNEVTLV